MNIVSYGGGINSTAMLIECVKREIPIDLILFADTGGERPDIYKYINRFNKWLIKNKMPEITRVQRTNINGTYITLEGYCFAKKQLPSLAYGFKSCSQKHKIQPQDKFLNNYKPAKEEWKAGRKITKFVGYDADEPQRAKNYTDNKYIVEYPLIEWDMGRDECVDTIRYAGLDIPGKSACYFCPSSKKHEIKKLQQDYPELAARAIDMEKNADLTKIKGLGRSFSWGEFLSGEEVQECSIEIDCGCYDG